MKLPTKEQTDKAIVAHKEKLEQKENELSQVSEEKKFEYLLELCDKYKVLDANKTMQYAKAAFKFPHLTVAQKAKALFHLSFSYSKVGNKKEALKHSQKSLKFYKKTDNKKMTALVLNLIGSLHLDFADFDKAISHSDKALEINEEIGNKAGICRTLVYKAEILNKLAKHHKAQQLLKKALTISKNMKSEYQRGDIYQNIGRTYYLISQFKEAKDFYKQSVNSFYKQKDWTKMGSGLMNVAVAYMRINEYEKAEEYFEFSLYISKKFGNNQKTANIYQNMGILHHDLGNFEKSLKLYKKAHKMQKQLGNEQGAARALSGIANEYVNLGQLEKGLNFHHRSLKIFRKLGIKSSLAFSLNNIGYIYFTLQDYEKALTYYKEALEIKKGLKRPLNTANTLVNIAIIKERTGDYQQANAYYHKALKIGQEAGSKFLVAVCYSNLGSLCERKEEIAKAKEYFAKSLDLAKKIKKKNVISSAQTSLARLEIKLNEYKEAEKHLDAALKLAEKTNSTQLKKDCFKLFITLYEDQKDYKKALEYYRKFTEAKESLESKETKEKISELEAKYENEKKEKEIEQLKYENKIEKMRNEIADRVKDRLEKEVKLRTKELEASRRQYRDLIDEANDGIIILQNNRIRLFNKKFQNMLKYKPEKYENALFTDFIPKELHNSFLKRFDSENTSIKLEEIFLISKDESKINVELSLRIVEYERKKAKLMIIRDITQRKLADQKMIYAETLSGIGELAGGFAHEIKNPLTNINAAVQLLQSNYEMDEEIGNYLDIIKKNTKKANKSVDNLIEFAKPRSAELEKLDLSCLLETVLTLLRGKMRRHNIKVKMEGFEDCPKIFGDHIYLQSAFINILLNAVQACKKEGKITIACDCEDVYLSLRFKDNGIGISQKEKNRIFDPFYTTKKRGSGLGLSMVKKVIHEHKGKINVESEEGKGTEIEVHFPLNGEQILEKKDEQYEELDLNN